MNDQSQQSTVQQQPAGDGQEMRVASPSAAREESARLSAVFVAHGMGQQRKFETLDLIASGLRNYDIEVNGKSENIPEAITIDSGDGYLHGVKLRLNRGNAEREVHIFEGYWAPLAEGAVNLRELMAFLVGAGFNGLAKTGRPFIRFLFNTRHTFPADFPVTILLLTAMLVVAALVIMNTAIVTVAALNAPLVKSPDWLSGLQLDLKTLFNLFLIVAGAFGLIILRSYTLRPRVGAGDGSSQESQEKKRKSLARRRRLIIPSFALFIVTIVTTIACGLAIPLLFYGHAYGRQPQATPQTQPASQTQPAPQTQPTPQPTPTPEYLKEAFGAGLVSTFNRAFSLILFILLLLVVVVLLVKVWAKIKTEISNPLLWGAVVMLAVILWLNYRLAMLPDLFGGQSEFTVLSSNLWTSMIALILRDQSWSAFTAFSSNLWAALKSVCDSLSPLSWPLLIAVSWYVRGLLVQYVGDVAVYVASHKLDRFNSLRDNIRKTVYTAAEAVYKALAAPAAKGDEFAEAVHKAPAAKGDGFAYDNVFIVGHSLGAVVVYDALNRLINETELRRRKLNEDEKRRRKLNEDELRERELNVAGRTKLLLTFGSPQDKIAFLFARSEPEKPPEKPADTEIKGSGSGTEFIPIREALAAAAQPLVQSTEFRQFEWINIYSKQDIISGPLDFFDPPPAPTGHSIKPVQNLEDEEACTLLAAHVEYWDNPQLRQILHKQITQQA